MCLVLLRLFFSFVVLCCCVLLSLSVSLCVGLVGVFVDGFALVLCGCLRKACLVVVGVMMTEYRTTSRQSSLHLLVLTLLTTHDATRRDAKKTAADKRCADTDDDDTERSALALA